MIIHGKEDYHIGYYEDYTLLLIHALASHANIINNYLLCLNKNVDISSNECQGYCPVIFCFIDLISVQSSDT